MAGQPVPAALPGELWRLAARQHGAISRVQLLAGGLTRKAIEHRIATGRLYPLARGVHAVGRPDLPWHGQLMVAVLSCGPDAVVSHHAAAVLWGIRRPGATEVDVTVPGETRRRRRGVRLHRRDLDPADRTERERVPVTGVHRTLLDLASMLRRDPLEAAINEADKLDLTNPERLRRDLERYAGHRGGCATSSIGGRSR